MSAITPGEFSQVTNSNDPESDVEQNFELASRMIYMREPRAIDGVATTLAGPPATGEHVTLEFWRDVHGAEYVCTAEGEPGTWKQIRPAMVTSEPSIGIPDDYWIVRYDQQFKHYRYTGTGFEEMFLSLNGGTMRGTLILADEPTSALHAATKAYVDALAGGGADPKDSCRAATTANVNLSTGGLLTIDGVALHDGDRVLVMNQTAGAENGIYDASAGAWARSADADSSLKVTAGMYCFVTEGTVNGDKGYVLTTDNPTLGTTALTFVQFSKGLADGECTDAKISNRTVDQSLASPSNTGALTDLLSWMAGRLKAVTGKSDWKTTPQTSLENAAVISLNFVVDGGGSVLTTGVKGFLEIPFNMTITAVTLMADQSGSVVIDIWKDTYANFPPTVADTITASAKPTLSSAQKSKDTTLTGWTTSVTGGDILAFNVDSATTVQRLTVSIIGKKT